MKNFLPLIFITLAFFLFTFSAKAQVSNYTFTQSTGTYSPISGTTLFGTTWDESVSAAITIPFTFTYNNLNYSSCRISTNGFLTFGTTAPGTALYAPISATTGYAGAVSALGFDLINNGVAMNYTTQGTTPNRVFIVEWKNARRYAGAAVTGDNFNFQIRLYETTNVVDVMYGTCAATNTTARNVQVGLRGANNSDYNNRTTTSNWSATAAGTSNAATCATSNTVLPSNGLIFRWSPPAPCSGTPSAATAAISSSGGIAGTTFNISYSGAATGIGISHIWQYSYNGGTTWTDWAGQTGTPIAATTQSTILFRVKTTCSGSGLSGFSNAVTYTVTQWNLNTSATATTCGGTFYDSGGPGANYAINQNFTYTFYPAVAGSKIRVNFTSFVTEGATCATNFDWMRIYDGPTTASPLINCYSSSPGIGSPGIVTSTAADGSLTFNWKSDDMVVAAGWAATIECFNPCNPPATPGAISGNANVCGTGNQNYTIAPVSGADSYTWAISSGGTVSGGQGTTNATINWTTNGNHTISVSADIACGSSAPQTTLVSVTTAAPGQPGAFTSGPASTCGGQSLTYSVPAVSGATSYNWSYTGTGATFNATTATPSQNISFSGGATSGTLSITALNGCGSGLARTMSITLVSAPTVPAVSSSNNCTSGAVTLTATGAGAGEGYRWYDSPSGGSIVSTASVFTPSINNTTNFYLVKVNTGSGCESSPRVAVPAYVKGLDQYNVTRTTGVAYADIVGQAGTFAVTSWRNGTSIYDNLSNNLPIGFSFNYDGATHNQFRISNKGFITFNTSSNANGGDLVACGNTEPYTHQNTTFSTAGKGGSLQSIAPFYDDLQTNGFALNASMHYQLSGTTPNRVLTVQWRGMSVYVNTDNGTIYGNYNFQVKLYEATGNIEFNYGTMTTGSSENSKSYTSGLNSSTLSTPLTTAKLFTQQTANTANFNSNAVNNLTAVPATNTRIQFVRTIPAAPIAVATCVSNNYPDPGATNQCLNSTLFWSAGDGSPASFNVYFGTSPTPPLAGNVVSTHYNPGNLAVNTTYYWRIVPLNSAGTSIVANMPVWSFSTGAGDEITGFTSSGGVISGNTVILCPGEATTITIQGSLSEGSEFNWTAPFLINLGCKSNPPYPLFGNCAANSRTFSGLSSGSTSRFYVFTRGCNGTSACQYIEIKVLGAFNAGTVENTGELVCEGEDPSEFSMSTSPVASSYDYQWYYKDGVHTSPTGTTNPVSAGWTAIGGSGAGSVGVGIKTEDFIDGIIPPAGWAYTSLVENTSCYGVAAPALEFTVTNARIETETFPEPATQLSFFAANKTYVFFGSNAGTLRVEGWNGSSWIQIDNFTISNSLSTCSGNGSKNYTSLPPDLVRFRFTFTKGSGNIVFDDLKITFPAPKYNPPVGITTTRTYAIMIDPTGTPDCAPATWAASQWVVTVQPGITNNTISGGQTLCAGTTPSAIPGSTPSGGNNVFTYEWESSTTSASAGFTAIVNSNVKDYSPGPISQTTWFRRLVTSGSCTTADTSYVVEIATQSTVEWIGVVDQNWFVPGNWSCNTAPVATSDVVIPAGVPNFPVVPYVVAGGVTVKAEANNLTINANASVGIDGNAILELNSSFVNNGVEDISIGKLRINSGSPATISGQIRVGILEIDNAGGASLAPGTHVRFTEALNLMNGALTVPSTANLTMISTLLRTAYIDDFSVGHTGALSGSVTVQRYVHGPAGGFHHIGSAINSAAASELNELGLGSAGLNNAQVIPLAHCDPNSTAQNSPYGRLFEWREEGPFPFACNQWGWFVRSAGNLQNGRGYSAIVMNAAATLDIKGAANTGNINHAVSNTNVDGNGWQLMANPYPSSIDWAAVRNSGTGSNTFMDAAAHVWQSSGTYKGTYMPMLAGISPNTIIASSQGYMAKVSAPGTNNFTYTQDHRVTGSHSYHKQTVLWESILNVDVSGNGFADKTTVYFGQNPTTGFDTEFDAYKLKGKLNQPMLYTLAGAEKLAINGQPVTGYTPSVVMGFEAGTSGTYSFTFGQMETFPATAFVYLEDTKTGKMVNLRIQDTYTFTATPLDDANRFVLHFTPPMEVTTADAGCDNNTGMITLVQPGSTFWNYTLVTDGGDVVATGADFNGTTIVDGLAGGNYTLNLSHSSGYSVTEMVEVAGKATVTADFVTDNTSVFEGEPVHFVNKSAGATAFEWNFGTGATTEFTQNPVFTYEKAGVYTVTLRAVNEECQSLITKEVSVEAKKTSSVVDASVGIMVYAVDDNIIIRVNGSVADGATVEVFNTLGQVILPRQLLNNQSQQEISMKDVTNGVYLIHIRNGEKEIRQQMWLGSSR